MTLHTCIGGFDRAIQNFLKRTKNISTQVSFSFTSPLQTGFDAFPPSASSSRSIVLNEVRWKFIEFFVFFLLIEIVKIHWKRIFVFFFLIEIMKIHWNFDIFLTHWNRRFFLVSPSVSSRSLLFSLPWLFFERNKFTFKIHLFDDPRSLSRGHGETGIEFDFINTIGQIELSSWSFNLLILSLWALHPSFVNSPFHLCLFFLSLIFSVPWLVYDKLMAVVRRHLLEVILTFHQRTFF